MPIKADQVVTISYTLKDEEGNLLDSAEAENPFSFISGREQILPKLEEKLGGMLIGSKQLITLSPEDAYGVYEEEAVQSIGKQEFPEGTKFEIGMSFMAKTPDGKHMPFVISDVEEESITVDFNHPLAGKTLTFELELINLRDASSEELAHGHVHGPGGHHH